ncbi:MAG: hypothetical protein EAZ53_13735 [Bacteroidetes bacterium]|nr:MAG: hypothetical protein EAZ53_13735 [Bacteroidota bacterium]
MTFDKETKKEIGKFLVDMSKLVFGGVILASIIKTGEIDQKILVIFSLIVTLTLALGGFILIFNANKK